MDHINSNCNDLDVDLESGGTTSEEDGISDSGSSGKHANKLLGRAWGGLMGLDGSIKSGEGLNVLAENAEMMPNNLGPEMEILVDKNIAKDKRKKTRSKIPSKPPRPPRGPSLNHAGDIKLVREFSELAALKRKRTERMKSLRKMKAEKGSMSSLNTNIVAMIVTLLFCLVIIFQGLLGSRV